MAKEDLTIDETKTYKFNLSGDSTFDKYYKIQKELDKKCKEHMKALLDLYEKQDREVLKKCLINSLK